MKITLGPTDAALVFRKNGTIDAHVPQQADDDLVFDSIQALALCATMLHTPKLRSAVEAVVAKQLKELRKNKQ